MSLDAASFGAGFGAGQAGLNKARGDANAAIAAAGAGAAQANLNATIAGDIADQAIEKLTEARKEIKNRWIPYAINLRGSLLAGKVERDVLIDELKRLDPANAESIAQKASRDADEEYASFRGEKAEANYQAVLADSEARRRDK